MNDTRERNCQAIALVLARVSNTRDVVRARRVCRAWKLAADAEVAKRERDAACGQEAVPIPVLFSCDVPAPDLFDYMKFAGGAGRGAELAGCDGSLCVGGHWLGGTRCAYLYGKLRDAKYVPPIVECNSYCACSSEKQVCCNRVVQFGITLSIGLARRVSVKGWQVEAVEDIPRGAFVCTYGGTVVPAAEEAEDPTYVLTVREISGAKCIRQYSFDASHCGSIGRFVNHSCEPNMVIHPVRISHAVPTPSFFALRKISAGEELTIDYSQNTPGDFSSTECMCGAPACRGFLPRHGSIAASPQANQ